MWICAILFIKEKIMHKYETRFLPNQMARLYWQESYRFARTMWRGYNHFAKHICARTKEPYDILAYECYKPKWDILSMRQKDFAYFTHVWKKIDYVKYQLKMNECKRFHVSFLPEWF